MKLPNFTILPWSETNRKKVLLLYVNFTNPIYQEKISCDTLLLTKITVKTTFISSDQFIKFFLPSPLAPFLWIYPHHNTIKTI